MLTISDEASYNTWVNIDGTGDADGTYNHFTYDPEKRRRHDGRLEQRQRTRQRLDDFTVSDPLGRCDIQNQRNGETLFQLHFGLRKIHIVGRNTAVTRGMIEFYNCENFKEKEFTLLGGAFTPESDGTYYIGLKATSSKWMGKFWVKGIQVEELLAHPGAVWGFDVNAAAEGALEAVLSWNWPEKSDLDSELTSISAHASTAIHPLFRVRRA